MFNSIAMTVAAQSWVSLGPVGSATYNANVSSDGLVNNGTGQIHCIAFHPDYNTNNIMFAGTPYGGLWRSNDGGVNWVNVPLVDGSGQQLEVNSVNDIVLTKQGTNVTLYITTGSSSRYSSTTPWVPSCGIYKSNNLGATFKPVGTFNTQFGGYTFSKQKIATKIAIHPTDTTQLFVACSDGLAKSTNAGATWSIVLTDGDEGEPTFDGTTDPLAYNSPLTPGIWSVAYSPTNINTIYASGRNVYKSTSSGDIGTFSIIINTDYENRVANLGGINMQRNMNIEVTQSVSSDLVYCTSFIRNSGNKAGYVAYRSSTGGQAPWTFLANQNQFGAICTDDRLKIDSRSTNSSEVIAGIVRLGRSSNSGLTWGELGNGSYHDDIHEIKYNPLGTEVFLGTDGGVWRYNPSTNVLIESNFGLSISTVLDMATSPKYKGHLSSGKQDTNYDFFNGTTWTQDGERGDGYPPTWFDRTEPEYVFLKRRNTKVWKRNVLTGAYTQVNIGNGTVTCFPNDTASIEQIYQNPLPVFSDRFYTSSFNRIHLSNSTTHLSDLRLLSSVIQTPPVYGYAGIRKFVINKQENALYATQRNGGFWTYSHISKFNLSNFSDPIANECFTNDNCIAQCTEEIDYINHPTNSCLGFYTASSVAFDANLGTAKMWVAIDYDDKFINHPKYVNNGCQALHNGYRYKIRKRVNGTWSNDDIGLPDYPIRNLVYVDGSNDAMFCATANGRIFYKNASLTQWQEVNPNLPRSPISKLEINYCTKRLYVATYGRGIYYVDLNSIPAHTNQALQITTSQTWVSNYYDIGSDIIVKSGQTLSIDGGTTGVIVNMSKDSKIVIERGAKLITNGVTFTNSCGEFWQGIHVWGDNTKRQVHIDSLANHPSLQGVCLLNNSALEYMNGGVRMGNAVFNAGFNGGQLVANQVQFKNNNMSIIFLPYNPPYDAGNTQAYVKSKIMRCDFDNEEFASVQLNQHVLLSGVKGVSIEGNFFKNSLSPTTYPLATSRGYGIYSTDATFIALPHNSQIIENNKFEGLTYGIAAQYTGAMSYPYGVLVGCKVNKAEFVGNRYGIYITGGSVFHKITENTFSVPGVTPVKTYGIYIEGTQAYKVQENNLFTTGSIGAGFETYGILVSNDNTVNEKIRKNNFKDFRYALTAVGQNSNLVFNSNNTGLQFLCNKLETNRQYDIWVAEKTVGSTTTKGSIRYFQGDCGVGQTGPANNQFIPISIVSPVTPTLTLARNLQTEPFQYNYPTTTSYSAPPYTLYYEPKVITTVTKNNCGFSGVNFNAACPNEIEPSDYQPALLNQWNGEINAMRQLIDDGNTAVLKQELQQASSYSIDGVYDELLAKEAISTDVLTAAIENPYAEYGLEKLKEVIVKNSGLRDTTIDILLARQLPYSSTDITEMELAQQKQSPEDEINSAITAKISKLEEHLVAWSEQYNEQNKPDSAKLMLTLYDNQSALTRLSLAELQWGLYDEALLSAKKIGDKKLEEYIDLTKANAQNSGDWKTMDSSSVSNLWKIYCSSSIASASAKAALGVILDTLIAPYLPSEDVVSFKNENMLANKWQQMKAVNKGIFLVSPNPTAQEFVLSYKVDGINSMEIQIYDQNGKLVDERSSKGASKTIAWRVDSWQNGVYLIKAIDDKQQRYFAKLNVQH